MAFRIINLIIDILFHILKLGWLLGLYKAINPAKFINTIP